MDKDVQADKSKVLAWFAKQEDKKKKPEDGSIGAQVAKGDPKVRSAIAKAFGGK